MDRSLSSFAFFPNYPDAIAYSAENMAAREEWDYTDTQEKEYPILKNYLNYTFRKLEEEDKIAYTADKRFACFNTGLMTYNYEETFAFFEQSKYPTTPFYFKAFLKKNSPCFFKDGSRVQIANLFENIPSAANYFEKPELLIFNPTCEIDVNYDHIIQEKENRDRFPAYLRDKDDRELWRHLRGAIEEVKQKVKTNYKIAVPQYFKGQIQLLLPLCLTGGSPDPDLALAVAKVKNTYSASTCLTLEMAYNNARLIVKPQSNWLKP